LGLGELYERDYMKKAIGYDAEKAEKEGVEEKAKTEIKMLFANICSKLDALSNYHFTPRPVVEETEVRSISTPAIAMEEVIPTNVSDARAVAPEQIYDGGKKRGRESVVKGDSEMTQEDRKRLRSVKKKSRRKKRAKQESDMKLVSRLTPGGAETDILDGRKIKADLAEAKSKGGYVEGVKDKVGDYSKSGEFFGRLADSVGGGGDGGDGDGGKNDLYTKKGGSKGKKASQFKM